MTVLPASASGRAKRPPAGRRTDDYYAVHAESLTAFTTMMRNSSPLALAHHAEGPFTAELTQRTIDRMVFATVSQRSKGLLVRRDDLEIRRNPSRSYMLVHQLEGESVVRQGGRTAHLKPGDFAVTTCTNPHELRFDRDARVFVALVLHSQIDLAAESVSRVTARTFQEKTDAVSAIASSYFRAYAESLGRIDGLAGLQLTRHLVELTTTCLAEAIRLTSGVRPIDEVALFNRITDYITANLAEPDLTPQTIADAHFISPRRLHALFQGENLSVARWVRDRRLKNCRWDLAAPQHAGESVYEIAARWGFNDPAYFSRIFREEFSESPREWRARCATEAGSAP